MNEDIKGRVVFNSNFFQVPNEIFDLDLDLNIYEKMIYIYLCRCGNNGGSAFPSYNGIAKKCCCSRDKAIKSMNKLIDLGFIRKLSREEPDTGICHSNVYEIMWPDRG